MKKGIAVVILLATATAALAAPGLPVTRPPVMPNVPAWTGPAIDPDATMGQWFANLQTQGVESRPFQLHDNVLGSGGGLAR